MSPENTETRFSTVRQKTYEMQRPRHDKPRISLDAKLPDASSSAES